MKLALIDQSFHWPPTGGSWVDLRETAVRLVDHGFSPKIFVPHWERWNIPGGRIDSDPGVPIEVIPLRARQFNFSTLPKLLKKAVDSWNPARIMIGNTFYMAPHIIRQFRSTPVFLRMYAHELLCLNYMNLSKCNVFRWYQENPKGDICSGSVPQTPWQCWRCSLRHMARTLTGNRNPVAVEYWSSLACLPVFHRILNHALNNLSGILVYNPFIKSLLSSVKTKTHVVPAGIDTERFKPRIIREPGPIRILLTGRLDDQRKGYDSFRECIRILANRRNDFEAWVTDPRSERTDAGIRNAGWVSWDALPELYRRADIVVCPSIWPEPFGITALEGMSTGLPVAASRIGGFHYTVIDGVTGFHFDPGDAEAMADILERLVTDAELRERLGKAGRERVLKHFTWDSIVNHYTAPILKGLQPSNIDWTTVTSDAT